MKRLLTGTISVLSVAVAGTALVFVTANQPKAPELPQVTFATVQEKITEPKPEPVLKPSEPVVTSEPVQTQVVTEKPIESVSVPSNDDLIAQYGWTQSPNIESIGWIIDFIPSRFTDELREESFATIKKAADIHSLNVVGWNFYNDGRDNFFGEADAWQKVVELSRN